jgi:metallo-beta-lactamase class B
MRHLTFVSCLLLAALTAIVALAAPGDNDRRFPPHKVAGNLYYVGSKDLAAYLVATKDGHILINSCFAETVPWIKESVGKLGYKWTDVKFLLNSHGHNDHCAGNALVRKETGCKVLIMEGDDEIVRTGGKGDFQYDASFEPCPVDRVLKDGDVVKLGGSQLTAVKTAGHTRGCTTWTMKVSDGGKTLNAVIIGSPNVNPGYRLVNNGKYPSIAEDYKKTFKTLKSLPVDLFLGAHGQYYGLDKKYPKLKSGLGNPFIDAAGYLAYVTEREQAFLKELERQRKML